MTDTLSTTQLQERLKATQDELAHAHRRLGEAVAGGDDQEGIRSQIADLEDSLLGLTHAMPIAEGCERAEAEELAAERAAQHRRDQNAKREARLEAAQRVDEALAELGVAYRELAATATGGGPKDANRISLRSDLFMRCAIRHHAPELADAMTLQRPRAKTDIRPLKESEAMTIGEQ